MGSSWRPSCAGWWSDLSDPYLQGEALVTQASHLPRPPCSAAALERISAYPDSRGLLARLGQNVGGVIDS